MITANCERHSIWKSRPVAHVYIHEESGTDLSEYQVCVDLDASNCFYWSRKPAIKVYQGFTSCNYWAEYWDYMNKQARIWVRVPSIPANSTICLTIVASPFSTSNGDATFDFFDDFENEDYTDKWTLNYNGSYAFLVEESGVLKQGSTDTGGGGSPAGSSINASVSLGDNEVYEFKIPFSKSEGWQQYFIDFCGSGTHNYITDCDGTDIPEANDGFQVQIVADMSKTTGFRLFDLAAGTRTEVASVGGLSLSNYILKIAYSVPTIKLFTSTDGGKTWTERLSWNNASTKTGTIFLLSTGCGDRYGWIEYAEIRVRKYVSPEPSVTVVPV